MRIVIETIPHNKQRYETVGDYQKKKGLHRITVSDTGIDIYNKIIAVHEMVEMIMVEWKGISEEVITQFDKKFESKRKKGNTDEPGFDPKSPYRHEHAIATAVELMMCAHMGISWKEYEEKINSL